jgi:dinuclear metal center YbgI/SA1388 family protein
MTCEEIIRKLEEEYPLSCAEDWDNPGLLVGRRDREVRKIYVALDVTEELLEEAAAWGAELIISHHPMIFGSIKQVNSDTFLGRKILTLAENRMCCYAMHTNFDVRGMADLNARQIGLQEAEVLLVTGEKDGECEGIGRIGRLERPVTLKELAGIVKRSMGLPDVRCYGQEDRSVSRIAVSGGSGKMAVRDALKAGAEVLVTGDIDYHMAIDAMAEGMCLIDAGHYGTECGFIAFMAERLRALFPECEVKEAGVVQPFRVF